jgi:two-component system, OmpR family, phosphate regulon response regulator PhoB
MKNLILVVDDEIEALELIRYNLEHAGFEVVTAGTAEIALDIVRDSHPNMMILDLMLPGIDGFELCKILRREPATASLPILMLTAKVEEIDRILGLELGADDYLTKPFSPRELVLRVKNLLRHRQSEEVHEEQLHVGPLLIDIPNHQAFLEGREILLTATEFKLLITLVQRRGRVQTREKLLHDVWEYDTVVESRTIDTHLRRLREKLGPAAKYISTVRGVGYRFVDE